MRGNAGWHEPWYASWDGSYLAIVSIMSFSAAATTVASSIVGYDADMMVLVKNERDGFSFTGGRPSTCSARGYRPPSRAPTRARLDQTPIIQLPPRSLRLRKALLHTVANDAQSYLLPPDAAPHRARCEPCCGNELGCRNRESSPGGVGACAFFPGSRLNGRTRESANAAQIRPY